ncbi:hypothetical protein KUTeg_012983 [Tegillarca granosa]|uniref:THAP-type domain-containing protein n=1 Tax=Tegillarca granosa TaxID=220873 RepID=A0ABQ9ESC8_TEGGR|nr:hypothetical protein KUTeg_012983 [Tegillarca granosa]
MEKSIITDSFLQRYDLTQVLIIETIFTVASLQVFLQNKSHHLTFQEIINSCENETMIAITTFTDLQFLKLYSTLISSSECYSMVKRCSHGTCKTDDRYPDRLSGGVKFVPFPKPKTEYDKCLRWIRLCGRPHDQLNPTKINANRYVCTKMECTIISNNYTDTNMFSRSGGKFKLVTGNGAVTIHLKCNVHFVNQSWPTRDFPDPLPADPYTPKDPRPARMPPSKRRKLLFENSTVKMKW